MRPILTSLAALAIAAGLAGCNPATTVTASDAQSLSQNFCTVWLPAAAPVIPDFSAAVQKNYALATKACADLGNGSSINAVSVAVAALDLYNAVHAVYPAKALSDHDLTTAKRLVIGARMGVYIGAH